MPTTLDRDTAQQLCRAKGLDFVAADFDSLAGDGGEVDSKTFIRQSLGSSKSPAFVNEDACRQFLDAAASADIDYAQKAALQQGCDIHWSSKKGGAECGMYRQGFNAVGVAASSGQLDMAMWMCEVGIDPDASSSTGETPVLAACKRGDLPVVQ